MFRRTFLLLAQVQLVNILGAKLKGNIRKENFETETYNTVMGIYYNWNRGEQR